MKNRSVHFMGLALSAVFLFSCATGNKYSKVSYGGAWADAAAKPAVAAGKTESAVQPSPETINTDLKTNVATVDVVSMPTTVSSVSTTEKNASVVTQVSNVKQKTGLKQKIANRVAKKMLSQKHSNEIDNKLVLVIIAIFLPWLAVLLYEGEITLNFWLSLLLWFLFWIPGFIYALLVIFDVI